MTMCQLVVPIVPIPLSLSFGQGSIHSRAIGHLSSLAWV
jgi:hypothetical protein